MADDEDNSASGTASMKRRRPLPHSATSSSPITRIYKLLASRLSGSLLASLILLPILPSEQRNAIFEIVPLYKSLGTLLFLQRSRQEAHIDSTPILIAARQRRLLEQWLSYWAIYASLRFLEATRVNISTSQQRWRTLYNALDLLPRMLREKATEYIASIRGRSSDISLPPPSSSAPRNMTLATQLAGSPARWTAIKCILLFYAMDEELQGARWILNKIIKPIAGFFTGLDDGDDHVYHVLPSATDVDILSSSNNTINNEETLYLYSDHHHAQLHPSNPVTSKLRGHAHHPATRRQHDSAKDGQAEEEVDEGITEPVEEHGTRTPELSLDGSCGGSVDEGSPRLHWGTGNAVAIAAVSLLDGHGADNMDGEQLEVDRVFPKAAIAAWPIQTVAVEGNHWVQ